MARQGLGDLVCYNRLQPQQENPQVKPSKAGKKSDTTDAATALIPPLQRLRKGLLATAALYELLSSKLKWLNSAALDVELGVRWLFPLATKGVFFAALERYP